MNARQKSALAAIVISVGGALWWIATSFATFRGWVEGLPKMVSESILHPVFLLLLFSTAIALAIKALKSKEPPYEDGTPNKGSSLITISPTITVAPSISQASNSLPQKPSAEDATARPAVRVRIPRGRSSLGPWPNIIFVRAETIDAMPQSENPGRLSWHESSKSDASRPMGVVHFRNEGGSGVVAANNVNAQLTYYDSDGQEILSKLGGCWLETEVDLVDFGVGRTHALIVATVVDDKTCLLWNRRGPYDEGFSGETVQADVTESKKDVKTVDVKLIGEFDDVLRHVRFSYSILRGRPQLARQE